MRTTGRLCYLLSCIQLPGPPGALHDPRLCFDVNAAALISFRSTPDLDSLVMDIPAMFVRLGDLVMERVAIIRGWCLSVGAH